MEGSTLDSSVADGVRGKEDNRIPYRVVRWDDGTFPVPFQLGEDVVVCEKGYTVGGGVGGVHTVLLLPLLLLLMDGRNPHHIHNNIHDKRDAGRCGEEDPHAEELILP